MNTGANQKPTKLSDFIEKEEALSIYDITYKGEPIYPYIQNYVRKKYVSSINKESLALRASLADYNVITMLKSICQSAMHVLHVFAFGKHIDNAFFAFNRQEFVGGQFIDKFTDPLIECSDLKKSYLIFDFGRAGVHLKPRVHQKEVVYLDAVTFIGKIYAHLASKFLHGIDKHNFNKLKHILDSFADTPFISERELTEEFFSTYYNLRFCTRLFKRISPKRVFVLARRMTPLVAANKLSIKTIELQHGVTYGQTELYSGKRIEQFTPSIFLTFGEMNPKNVYGINENRIFNIGFAFLKYLEKNKSIKPLSSDNILVFSDPEINEPLTQIVVKLAKDNPNLIFHMRPHPCGQFSDEQKKTMNDIPNVIIQDNRINSNEAIAMFSHFLGENSTAMYEALSAGKKVAKLFYPGLHSKYLNQHDAESFWEVSSSEDLRRFISEDKSCKKPYSIYSEFIGNEIFKYI